MDDSNFLNVAKKAALAAGEIVKKYSKLEHQLFDKGRANDFATRADLESEKKIIEIIKKNFPGHSIIAEESGEQDNNSEFRWAIDPIDGTIPFVTGFPSYSVCIGLLKDNKPILGVINMVGTNELYWALKNEGAFVNNKQIRVSTEDVLANSSVSVEFGHTNRQEKIDKYLKPLMEKIRLPYSIGGSGADMAYVARGFFDGTINEANVWDYAAGAIIVEEAGGRVTNHEGGTIDWTKKRIFIAASNGLIHEELLNALKNG